MRFIDATALSGLARKAAESASGFASVVRNLIQDMRESHRPELHSCVAPARNGAPSISAPPACRL